jgi:hypothetical protein
VLSLLACWTLIGLVEFGVGGPILDVLLGASLIGGTLTAVHHAATALARDSVFATIHLLNTYERLPAAASAIKFATSFGLESIGTWLVGSTSVFAPMRLAAKRS